MRKTTGFSLIELVVVLLLGSIILGVVVGKYQDFTTQSRATVLSGASSALNTVSANNRMLKKAGGTFSNINNCNQIATLLPGGSAALPSGISVASGALALNNSATCNVSDTHGNTGTFIGWGTS